MIGVGCMEIGPKEKGYLQQVIESGHITSGPILKKFEQDFALRHGVTYGIMVNSGTSALQIGLAALKETHRWGEGAEVILPALTFIASANMIREVGLVPRFVDVDPVTYNIDPDKIEDAINPQTVAIMPVHLFGQPCDMAQIMGLARAHDLAVIEDSCESMGVTYNAKPVGSFGDIACFSTYAAHIISTGVGGLAITKDYKLYRMMRSYANHGRNPDFLGYADSKDLNPTYHVEDTVDIRFSFPRFGYSHRATQMEAALGLGQLERLTATILKRHENAHFLKRNILSDLVTLPQIQEDREHAWMMFPLVLPDGIYRTNVLREIEKAGVETRPFFDILGQPCYQRLGFKDDDFPVAKRLSAQGFYVGCHQNLSNSDLWTIAYAVNMALATTSGTVPI